MQKTALTHPSEQINTDSIIIDDGEISDVEISIAENIQVNYLFFPRKNGTFSRRFHLATWARFSGSGILMRKEIHVTIETVLEWDTIESSLQILALAQDNTNISVKGISSVEKPYRAISTRVDQTNILIGKDTQVKGTPILQIATDDIKWWHSCKVHRLGWEALFYLNSRGLDTKNAESLLLSGEIRRHLAVVGSESREKLYEEIMETLS